MFHQALSCRGQSCTTVEGLASSDVLDLKEVFECRVSVMRTVFKNMICHIRSWSGNCNNIDENKKKREKSKKRRNKKKKQEKHKTNTNKITQKNTHKKKHKTVVLELFFCCPRCRSYVLNFVQELFFFVPDAVFFFPRMSFFFGLVRVFFLSATADPLPPSPDPPFAGPPFTGPSPDRSKFRFFPLSIVDVWGLQDSCHTCSRML